MNQFSKCVLSVDIPFSSIWELQLLYIVTNSWSVYVCVFVCVLLLILAILVDGTSLWFYFFPWRWASFLTHLSLFFCIVTVQNVSPIFYQFSNLFCYLFVDVLSIFWIQIFCWRQNCKYFVLCCGLPFHTCDSMFLLAGVLNFNVFKYFKPVWPFWYVILNLWILDFWTLWEKARVGWSERTASKPICY